MGIREEIVAEARSWAETPWKHQAREKGAGVDCVGLITMTAKAVVESTFDLTDYDRAPDGIELMRICRATMDEIHPWSAFGLGDVLVMQFAGMPHHLGIVGDYKWGGWSLIHAHSGASDPRVLEHRLDLLSSGHRVIAAFRYRGVPA